MNKTKKYLLKILKITSIFSTLTFAMSCSNTTELSIKKMHSDSWDKNNRERNTNKNKEIRYKSNKDLIHKGLYSNSVFEKIYSNKDFYEKPKDLINNFNFLEDIDGTDHNTTYQIKDLYKYAAKFANIIIENDENILGWKTSSSTKYDDKAIVYLQGGPENDFKPNSFWIPQNIYGQHGETYYFNQSQFGFQPINYVYKEKQKYLDLNFSRHIKNKIKNEDITDKEAINILLENTSSQLNIIEVLLSTSMAFSKVNADKLSLLGKILQNEKGYEKTYMGGWSHGFSVGIDAILNNPKNLDIYTSFVLENNLLMAAQKDSGSNSGGIMEPLDDDFVCVNCLDDYFAYAIRLTKDVYGQKDHLAKLMEDPKIKRKIQKKVYFKSTYNDDVIGNPTEEELIFYCENGLNFTFIEDYSQGKAHWSEFTTDQYKSMFA